METTLFFYCFRVHLQVHVGCFVLAPLLHTWFVTGVINISKLLIPVLGVGTSTKPRYAYVHS